MASENPTEGMLLKSLQTEVARLQTEVRRLNTEQAYANLRDTCYPQVVEWRWATWMMLDLEPYYSETYRFSRNRWMKKAPTTPTHHVEHGLDRHGNIVLMRWKQKFSSGIRGDEVFVANGDGWTTVVKYADSMTQFRSGSIEWAHFGKFAGERISQHFIISNWVWAATEYFYTGQRLSQAFEFSEDRNLRRQTASRFEYRHDDVGRLIEVIHSDCDWETAVPGGNRTTIWRRPPKGETVSSLSVLLQKALFDEARTILEGLKLKEPAYCVLLVYDAENDFFPPSIAVGLDSERQRFVQEHARSAAEYIWNPAEFQNFNLSSLEFKVPETLRACELLNQLLQAKDSGAPAKKLLNTVASELMRVNWQSILPTTDDFAIVAVDLEGQGDLARNAKQSLPPECLSMLKQCGWL